MSPGTYFSLCGLGFMPLLQHRPTRQDMLSGGVPNLGEQEMVMLLGLRLFLNVL